MLPTPGTTNAASLVGLPRRALDQSWACMFHTNPAAVPPHNSLMPAKLSPRANAFAALRNRMNEAKLPPHACPLGLCFAATALSPVLSTSSVTRATAAAVLCCAGSAWVGASREGVRVAESRLLGARGGETETSYRLRPCSKTRRWGNAIKGHMAGSPSVNLW